MEPYLAERRFFVGEKEYVSLAGVSNRLIIFCNETGDWTTYLSDRFGFNNLDLDWDLTHIEGVLLGDSFTNGACVKSGEDITSQLSQITGNSFLNLGVDATGPLSQLAILIEYGLSKKPKYIFWIYYEGNDLLEMIREGKDSILSGYIGNQLSQELTKHQDVIDQALSKLIKQAETSVAMVNAEKSIAENILHETRRFLLLKKLRMLLRFDRISMEKLAPLNEVYEAVQAAKNKQNQQDIKIENIFAAYSKIVRTAVDLVQSWEGKIFVVYLPEFTRYTTGLSNDHKAYLDHSRELLLDTLAQLDVPVIDIHEEVFSEHHDPLSLFPFRLKGHYTAEGYKQVAVTIIQEAGL